MADAKSYLDLTARLALRGMGHAEPNPLVGAVIVKNNAIIGQGHHRRCGQLHAEREALESCRRQGHDPRGSTIYITLEPCRHHGKQPPCTDALIAAGIARVVYAQSDPNSVAAGGADVLRAAGITVELNDQSPLARAVSLPFLKHTATDLPFVIAKWAQSIDGRLATRTGDSKWISSPASRRRVHLLRGRVDAIVTGIGTVLADDPLLTARGIPVRRIARRVVIDSHLRTPLDCKLIATAPHFPLTIFTTESAATSAHAAALRAAGAEVIAVPRLDASPPTVPRFAVPPQTVSSSPTPHLPTTSLDLRACLRTLRARHGVYSCLVEAGPRLLSGLRDAGLMDAAVVYIAPLFLGGASPDSPAIDRIAHTPRATLARCRACAGDVEVSYLFEGRTSCH